MEDGDLAMDVERGHPSGRSSTSCVATASKSARNRARSACWEVLLHALKNNKDKFSDMREHLRERFGGMERFRDLMGEMNQIMRFMFGKLREKGLDNPEMVKQLRMAMVNFKTEVEEILREQKKN